MRLILGDALEVLPTLPDASVDAVVTDPPYGQTNEAYDSPIAFSPDVWRECYRVAAKNAALVAFAGSPTYHRIASAIEAGGWKVRQMWAWVYRQGYITSAYPKEGFDRLAPAMDPIVYATKGKVLLRLEREGSHEWDRLTGRKEPFKPTGISARAGRRRKCQGVGHYPRTVASDGCSPFEYFCFPRSDRHDGRTGHPNQKPVALMRWIVSKLPDRVILDPFLGSGTTAVACLQEGRECIGIEREGSYLAIARVRLAAEEAKCPLFPPQEAV